ncbi:MAG: aminotransferase class V-fold PLP-dependent enzyme [Bacteroidota bacterium]
MKNEEINLLGEIIERLVQSEQENPVVPYLSYDELPEHVDLELTEAGLSDQDWVKSISTLIEHTPKTCTNAFYNQLFGGRHPKAVIGEMLAGLLNNSMYTYKVGGPMIAVEKTLLREIKKRIGYPSSAEGTIATGGSMTNFMAMLMARDRYEPQITETGGGTGLIAYTSDESHYSITKNARFAGIGRQHVRYIPSNDRGEMLPDALREQILEDKRNGLRPFFVNATSGTTVLGAFDPLDVLADICEEQEVWFHIDGAYGGAVMFSDQYRYLLKGMERSDSFSVNAHKMMGVPITCSFILTKHRQALYDSFSYDASYLYQTDQDEINPGKISLQCGRRNDALKFWALWKSIGSDGLRDMVDHQFQLAETARDYVSAHPDYTLYSHAPSVNICFNYKNIPADILCNALYESSTLMVGYGSHRGVRFIRLVTTNAGNTKEDILNFFSRLEGFADKY